MPLRKILVRFVTGSLVDNMTTVIAKTKNKVQSKHK